MMMIVVGIMIVIAIVLAVKIMDHARSKDKIAWSKEDKQ